jgi:hypothetical protein
MGGSASPKTMAKKTAASPPGLPNALRSRRGDRSTYRFARITRLATQISKTVAINHGARNAIATPIIRKLHIIALAL